jgi:hypothetical protein
MTTERVRVPAQAGGRAPPVAASPFRRARSRSLSPRRLRFHRRDATPIDTYAFDFGDGSRRSAGDRHSGSTCDAGHAYGHGHRDRHCRPLVVCQLTVTVITIRRAPACDRIAEEQDTADASAPPLTRTRPRSRPTPYVQRREPTDGAAKKREATHTYATSDRTVAVTVTDTAGLTATTSKTIKIRRQISGYARRRCVGQYDFAASRTSEEDDARSCRSSSAESALDRHNVTEPPQPPRFSRRAGAPALSR